jgi:hypothetical protein
MTPCDNVAPLQSMVVVVGGGHSLHVTVAVVVSAANTVPAATIAQVSLLMTLLLAGPQAMARLFRSECYLRRCSRGRQGV